MICLYYIIHSKSERGFWHNEFGWVTSALEATRFDLEEQDNFRLPLSAKKDAEWMPFMYGNDRE